MRDGREKRRREREDRKKRRIKEDVEMVGGARTTEDRMKRKRRTGAEQSGSYTARRGQQDWKRPMLDRDQLLSPTCPVDSRIIAWSLHGPWDARWLRYVSIAAKMLWSILKDDVEITRSLNPDFMSESVFEKCRRICIQRTERQK